jgi:hypothetical protein
MATCPLARRGALQIMVAATYKVVATVQVYRSSLCVCLASHCSAQPVLNQLCSSLLIVALMASLHQLRCHTSHAIEFVSAVG